MKIPAALAVLMLANPAAGQIKELEGLNRFLSKITGVPVPKTASSNDVSVPSGSLATPTPSQVETFEKAIAASVQADIQTNKNEAADLISLIVQTSACATSGPAWNRLNRVSESPQNHTYGLYSPMRNMQYHNKTSCLDVIRIDKWAKPAKNALSFRVQLISGQSDEAASLAFVLVKSMEGQWLIKSIG